MSEPVKEILPDAVKLLEAISANEPWSPVYRRALEDILKLPAIRAALREVLVQSDEQLKLIGMSDLTSGDTIQKMIRAQGVATGLSQAVETICSLASTPDNEPAAEENKNV